MMTIEELKLYLEPQFMHLDSAIRELKEALTENKSDNRMEHERFRHDLDMLFDRVRDVENKQAIDDSRHNDGKHNKEMIFVKWGLIVAIIGTIAGIIF